VSILGYSDSNSVTLDLSEAVHLVVLSGGVGTAIDVVDVVIEGSVTDGMVGFLVGTKGRSSRFVGVSLILGGTVVVAVTVLHVEVVDAG
jgi:hypothetical protein